MVRMVHLYIAQFGWMIDQLYEKETKIVTKTITHTRHTSALVIGWGALDA